MEPAAAQTQAVERINQASNILVTVSSNPSVDQLAACIGLTLLLNRMDKHATAVFSGRVPSTIEFLQPEKTLEANTDSLRDFIISLDKNKADKLRYKVEDQFVRIFITPYKTSLSEKDLVFSQGDFNVEAVIALGVHNRNELDAAITAHGRILHDATVISVVAGKSQAPDLGQINWIDPAASSLCEMLVTMGDSFGQNLIDNQMATAFLTGIVAETNRFSNDKTTPKAMSVSAKLMGAGANQQLIISKLEPPDESTGSRQPQPKRPPSPPPQTKGVLSVSHHPEVADTSEVEVNSGEIRIDEQGNIIGSSGQPSRPTPQARKALPDMPTFQPMAKPADDSSGPTGPHDLLDPTQHVPAISPPFTADTQPAWTTNQQAMNDPLIDGPSAEDKLIKRAEEPAPTVTAPPPADQARKAVNQAIAAAPFDPSGHPLASMGAKPLTGDLHPPQLPKIPGTAPPPVPPPLLPKNNKQ
ncbi:hypothetical protein A3F65_02755 [Candidatus Saccharibacteria bacterium RIFCSPHIGHO2_12_FULL_47_16b]|nr:MAG: hypothetical protein A3F65_02755 [Candidatus Saccharibacteria bacterium RIFCSPHIGHO2_12_FULL_47_16b]OGL38999.1 MAG: hypothetical protein A3J32_01220 [Candidatus Saccharibacteria bacterium RIFCSPLOWO2_02_FULL_46_7]